MVSTECILESKPNFLVYNARANVGVCGSAVYVD